MEQVRLAIVGLGRFARLHIECLRQMPSISIVAVCDIQSEQVRMFSEDLACKGYTDLQEMLRSEKLDALDILTPESNHYEAVMAGLAAGCHVFVEKPLESDLTKAENMIQYASKQNKLLMVGHVTRFDPRYIRMKQSIDRGEIGQIRSIYTRRSDKRQYFSIYKRTPVVYILGVHDIDQILWYKNELPVEVYAKSSSCAEGEDLVNAIMTFADKTVAMMTCDWLTPKNWPAPQDQYTQIMGDLGVLRMESPDRAFSLCSDDCYEFPYLFANRDVYGKIEGPLMSELSHFIDCILTAKPSTILLAEDALNVIRVATAIIQSCERGQPVRMSAASA